MSLNVEVTRRRLQLGDRDNITGWRAKTYEDYTIEMLIIPRSATNIQALAGIHVVNDAVGVTVDPVALGDEIECPVGTFYEVMSVQEHWLANTFMYRSCQLTLLPYHD